MAVNFKGAGKAGRQGTRRAQKAYDEHRRWAKKQNRKLWQRGKPIIKNLKNMMNDQMANAEATRKRYDEVFIPYEDRFMGNIEGYQSKVDEFSNEVARLKEEALDYGSEANREFLMGRAQATVGQAFEAARNNNLDTLMSYGVNPAAGRFAALDAGVRTAEAAAKAAAGTQAGLDTGETSRAMFQEALTREAQARGLDLSVLGLEKGMVDIGRTYPALEMAQQGSAVASGGAALGGQLSIAELGLKHRTSQNDFMRSLNDSINSWTNTLGTQADYEIEQEKLAQSDSSGIGAIAGAALPFVANLAVPGSGTVLSGANAALFAEGGPVTENMSPTGGAIEDDVSAMMTAGEFVFPREAVMKYGTDRLQKMVDKALGGATGGEGATTTEQAIPENPMRPMQPTPMIGPSLF